MATIWDVSYFETTIAADLTAPAALTSQTITVANGNAVPTVTGTDQIWAWIGNANVEASLEAVLITAHAAGSTSVTVTRGADNDPAYPPITHEEGQAFYGPAAVGAAFAEFAVGGPGHVIYNVATPLAQQPNLSFWGDTVIVTDEPGDNATKVLVQNPNISSTVSGLDESARVFKQAVRVATTGALTLASDVENGDTIDGVVLATNDRVLIKDQAAGEENGIYRVNASGAPTRSSDSNTAAEFPKSFHVAVQEGTANGGTLWQHTTTAAITLGTTALTFEQVGGGGVPGAHDHTGDDLVPDTVTADSVTANSTTGQALDAQGVFTARGDVPAQYANVQPVVGAGSSGSLAAMRALRVLPYVQGYTGDTNNVTGIETYADVENEGNNGVVTGIDAQAEAFSAATDGTVTRIAGLNAYAGAGDFKQVTDLVAIRAQASSWGTGGSPSVASLYGVWVLAPGVAGASPTTIYGVKIENQGATRYAFYSGTGISRFGDQVRLVEMAAPGTPPSGEVALYAKSDGKLYLKDDTGAETDLTAGGGGGMTDFDLDADTGTAETVGDGETVIIAGGDGVATSVAATNTVTVALDIDSLAADGSPDGAADYVVTFDDSAGAHKKVLLDDLPGGGGSGLYDAIVTVREEQTANTNGGTFTSGGDRTRVLNAEHVDSAGIASLASNQVTLPAGTYDVEGSAPGYKCDFHQAWLYDVTNTATLLRGTSEYNASADFTQTRSVITGTITLAGSTALEVRHRCLTTSATNGLGVATNLAGGEIFTTITFRRRA